MKLNRSISLTVAFIFFLIVSSPALAQEILPLQTRPDSGQHDVSILESRLSTTNPVAGDNVTYSLKFDSPLGVILYPTEHFSENGFVVVEEQHLKPQTFEGRVIRQYEYTLRPQHEGGVHFIPVSIHYAGPWKNSLAAQTEAIQMTIAPVVEVRVVSNSPLMLGEPLELSLAVSKHQPVTVTAMPQHLEAIQDIPSVPDEEQIETEPDAQSVTTTPTPTPQPQTLQCELDQSQNVMTQQVEGRTVEHYAYIVHNQPEQAGEYIIPKFTVTYRTATGEEIQAQVEATSIFVLNPNTGNLEIETDYRFLILPAIILAAVVLGGLLVLLYFKYRKSRKRTPLIYEPALPPGQVAHQELSRIQSMKLPAKGEFKKYYTLVSESVRKFLGAEFGFHVLERTTAEVMQDIQQRDIPRHVKEQTSKFLHEADMVKFAKYIPLIDEAETAMQEALTIVDESVEYHRPKIPVEEAVKG